MRGQPSHPERPILADPWRGAHESMGAAAAAGAAGHMDSEDSEDSESIMHAPCL